MKIDTVDGKIITKFRLQRILVHADNVRESMNSFTLIYSSYPKLVIIAEKGKAL